jgi:hypothetical protein
MSYDLKRSHFSIILERKVATGVAITEEGVLLQATLDPATGEEVVDLCANAVSQVVAGFAIRDNADNATTSEVEVGTVPAASPYQVQLSNNNLVASTPGDGSTSQLQVKADGVALTIVDGSTPASGECANEPVTGLLTFHVDETGQDLEMTYRYNLTVSEARLKFFQRNINNEAGALFGQLGVGHGHGEIYTDQYDTTVDWSVAGQAIHTGAAGTVTGSGGTAIDARVISVPNVNNPLLGLQFDLGGSAT